MSARTYRVKDVARLARVTVRTLHHYDEIGLLRPSSRTESGYRLYGEDDLHRLHQILLWRELGFPLEEVRRILDDPHFDRKKALLEQRTELVARGRRTEAMIRSVDLALESLKGENTMDAKELFEGFDPADYEDEARERWGESEAYRESARRTGRYKEQDWKRMKEESNAILENLAARMREGAAADDAGVVELAEQHRLHIDRWFYPCSRKMHEGLAGLYVGDDRFKANLERHGEGLAQFLADAIRANAAR
jgi:DNA-binding transcriptional MerR regulator